MCALYFSSPEHCCSCSAVCYRSFYSRAFFFKKKQILQKVVSSPALINFNKVMSDLYSLLFSFLSILNTLCEFVCLYTSCDIDTDVHADADVSRIPVVCHCGSTFQWNLHFKSQIYSLPPFMVVLHAKLNVRERVEKREKTRSSILFSARLCLHFVGRHQKHTNEVFQIECI